MLFSDLQNKQVINVVNGKCLGHVLDFDIDVNSGQICYIIIRSAINFFHIFSKNEGVKVYYDQIIKIGEDVVIVNYLNIDVD